MKTTLFFDPACGRRWLRLAAALLTFISCPLFLNAEIRLPHVLSSHMVVQREQPIHLWGWASPGSQIEVTLGKAHAAAVADDLGHWSAYLPPMSAGGPYSITVQGDGGQITLEDILIGDVWVASGQSNMEMPLGGFGPNSQVQGGETSIAQATDPKIRFLLVPRATSSNRLDDIDATWQVCSPESARPMSAVAYFFTHEVRSAEKVPVGLVEATWGGTPAEAWTSMSTLASDANLMPVFKVWSRYMDGQTDLAATLVREKREDDAARAAGASLPDHPWRPQPMSWAPAGLFNGMIAPLIKFSIKGVIWYQGENNGNIERAPEYVRLLPAMIEDWRQQWGQGDFPFLYAQISSFRGTVQDAWGVVRDAQRRALSLRNTGMAVTMDVGNPDNVHPTDKQTVGRRLASLAEVIAYEKRGNPSGPLFLRADVEGVGLRVRFSSKNLVCKDSCSGFEVAGTDHNFVPAQASVQGDNLWVSATALAHPVYVRYAWANYPAVSLFDAEGLPASTFTNEDEMADQFLIPGSFGQTGP